ncbi:Crp/Fnr family transcriptional regulator [Synechococcus sp. BO 8801]|uniref:Crp/Fnr family transcriptional regulator n=1 Tax=Synechococcus sp. BO 8801 TaxID=169670 RepID=UPI001E481301|nr:Crp/Fnr family transcriptional regulator [Synechococcus sp. BO 8801]
MRPPHPEGVTIAEGHTLLLEPDCQDGVRCFLIERGLLKVSLSSTDSQPITLGFLQAGDQLPLEFQRRATMHLEAITPVHLSECGVEAPQPGQHSLNDWAVDLLLIRRLTTAEQRLTALLRLLAERIGRRQKDWYVLPLQLTHAQIADLIGHTRVTVTQQFSLLRRARLIETCRGPAGDLRLAPGLVEPLVAGSGAGWGPIG